MASRGNVQRLAGQFSTTQWISPVGAPTSLPNLDFENPVRPDFLTCSHHALSHCWRRFGTSTENYADCMYGFLVASRLLPTQVMALADEVRIDTSGAFTEGASLDCRLDRTYQGYPDMVDYY